MPNDLNASSEYGPGKFQELFDRGLGFAFDRLLRRADAQGGNLSTVDIREELLRFKAEPGTDMVNYFEEAWRSAHSLSNACAGTRTGVTPSDV